MNLLRRIVDVRAVETRALLMAAFFNFLVLGSYYVLKPIRDDIGAGNGVEKLSWMFTGTMVTMIFANALFSGTVARMSRRRFIPLGYRFFILNLAVFYFLMRLRSPAQMFWVGVSFFVWVSVFNLFVVTLFWTFMTDVFNTDQGKRLFGFISVGGTVGGVLGATITGSLVRALGAGNLLIVSALMLEGAAWCVKFFPADFRHPERSEARSRDPGVLTSKIPPRAAATVARDSNAERPIGGGIISGISHVFRSPYLLGICGFMLLYAITTTIVYFQQADLTQHQFHDRAARTAFFAHLDTSVNILTALVQIFLTGRLLKWVGVGPTLAFLPVLSALGFVAMGISPTLALLAVIQVIRRSGNFAVTRPAREVLFTVLRREDKYKAKSFIDTFIYRTGDQLGAWTYALLNWLGWSLKEISIAAAPLALIWGVLSVWLGQKQIALAHAREVAAAMQREGAATT
ncbi:MAG: MFS transporter [Verrucomicrobia bacterium]|nr:MFS transporter [Verrucomicrobiota bacterium]